MLIKCKNFGIICYNYTITMCFSIFKFGIEFFLEVAVMSMVIQFYKNKQQKR